MASTAEASQAMKETPRVRGDDTAELQDQLGMHGSPASIFRSALASALQQHEITKEEGVACMRFIDRAEEQEFAAMHGGVVNNMGRKFSNLIRRILPWRTSKQ
ncbi:hypothetical protein AUJ46_04350 [Candidatus Peregrinibacteria bacterium CG1_02_54_53]|nr:MAG: hypothetical protein AUJ46_04350 [Candidatus Peregrinibacteria bacterium CG1_02_54_53]